MLNFVLLVMSFAAIPPVDPQLPLVVLKSSINAASNTLISTSITLAVPKSVGYSSWTGNFNVQTAIVFVTIAAPGDNSFPKNVRTGGTVINRGVN